MIDLHLHTTASDGWSSPAGLVEDAVAAGVAVLAVTDHDTMAAVEAVSDAAGARGLDVVPGIEVTAVENGQDVHILGYFLDAGCPDLVKFLTNQRADRRRRVLAIADLLARLGKPVDVAAQIAAADNRPGSSVGRPLVAAALVDAGHVATVAEAFEQFLAEGRPAFLPRLGASPAAVIGLIARARGVASLAHPGKLKRDALIPALVRAGLPALEVYHPDHDPADVARYRDLAARHGLVPTGGSDYHGKGSGRTSGLGHVSMPRADFESLVALAGRAGTDW